MPVSQWAVSSPAPVLALAIVLHVIMLPPEAQGQELTQRAVITGRVNDAASGLPIPDVTILIEGTSLRASSDSAGGYRIASVPAGPQVLRAQRLGYSATRVTLDIPAAGTLVRNLEMARHALQLEGIQVTADPQGRAQGELGTASVIEQEAIRNQMAASLIGVLELIPGVPLSAPGLDNVQQISLRAVPISTGAAPGERSAQDLSAFGTLIVVDGVPLSNNANLQSLGTQPGFFFPSAAGGTVDLRRIPAATIERVEVIRGIPSARFGDLTHGAIIVETQAGALDPAMSARVDATTTELSLLGGRSFGARHTATLTTNAARTRPGITGRDDEVRRVSGQFSHRLLLGGVGGDPRATSDRAVLDTRIDFFQLTDERPESENIPGRESRNFEGGWRIQERLRLPLGRARLDWIAAYESGRQRSRARGDLNRGAFPLTRRTEPGREEGRYQVGVYNAQLAIEGDPSFLYSRAELTRPAELGGFAHDLRAGAELRREANDGDGLIFDMDLPPHVRFDGVRGFDRPRSFADVPPLATSGVYLDDRLSRTILGGMPFVAQAGVRLDFLHENGTPFSGVRDTELQPRLNLELSPAGWIRLRAGAGRLAKTPALADLYPTAEYYDVINVNYFANEPEERLAVLTTFVADPTDPQLRFSVSDRAEAGVELRVGQAYVGVTAFADRLRGGVGIRPEPTFILREHFELTNVDPGSGQPPEIVEPAESADSVPILIQRPSNNLTQRGRGLELTADLPEIRAIRTRFSFQGSYVRSRLTKDGLEFATAFREFQMSSTLQRSPYYESIQRTGELAMLTTRIVHHQPELGLVITGTVQHTLRERTVNVGATDTLSFVGYITRAGVLVPIPESQRAAPEYADLRGRRTSVLAAEQKAAADWIFNLQVSKSLPRDARLSFYAFNALDRQGRYGSINVARRLYPSTRFGIELSAPLLGLTPWR